MVKVDVVKKFSTKQDDQQNPENFPPSKLEKKR